MSLMGRDTVVCPLCRSWCEPAQAIHDGLEALHEVQRPRCIGTYCIGFIEGVYARSSAKASLSARKGSHDVAWGTGPAVSMLPVSHAPTSHCSLPCLIGASWTFTSCSGWSCLTEASRRWVVMGLRSVYCQSSAANGEWTCAYPCAGQRGQALGEDWTCLQPSPVCRKGARWGVWVGLLWRWRGRLLAARESYIGFLGITLPSCMTSDTV